MMLSIWQTRAIQTALPMSGRAARDDLDTLQRRYDGYIRSVRMSDVGWFDENLAGDFMNSNPDGSLVERGVPDADRAAVRGFGLRGGGRAHKTPRRHCDDPLAARLSDKAPDA